jgi:hypothetical protein
MPIPIAIASFNNKVTNRLTAPFAGHLLGSPSSCTEDERQDACTGRRSTPFGGVTTMSS